MDYYKSDIKSVITDFPQIGQLLQRYGVDCVTCSVGTCLLKDVLSIHDFSREQEEFLTVQMNKIINREEVDISTLPMINLQYSTKKKSFSAPLQELVDEHKNIKRLLDLAECLVNKKAPLETKEELLNKVVFYVKNYADKLHHSKEEDILFKTSDQGQEIIRAMFTEHDIGREFVAKTLAGISTKDEKTARQAVLGYVELLRAHIKKEDEIL